MDTDPTSSASPDRRMMVVSGRKESGLFSAAIESKRDYYDGEVVVKGTKRKSKIR